MKYRAPTWESPSDTDVIFIAVFNIYFLPDVLVFPKNNSIIIDIEKKNILIALF